MAKKNSAGFQLDATSCDVDTDLIEEIEGVEEQDPPEEDDSPFISPDTYVPLKLPKEERERMRSQYDIVVVQDFKDEYHMTEEEKKDQFEFYDLFKRMASMKTRYRALPAYIKAYREAMVCLKAVAEVNGVYPEEEFMRLVVKGKIKVSGLKLPIYNGPGKKSINWELVTEYILDPSLDPQDLEEKESEAFYEVTTEDMLAEIDQTVFGGKLEELLAEAEEELKVLEPFDPDEDDPTGKNIVLTISKKELKKSNKINEAMIQGLKEYKKSMAADRQLRDYAFQMTSEDFAKIERMDSSRGRKYLGIPKFKGELFNSEDYDRYMYELEQYERKNTLVEYKDDIVTLEQYDELVLKDRLDENGWNIRNFYNIKEEEKEKKKREQKLQKKKRSIKRKLAQLEGKENKAVNSKKKKHKKSKIKRKVTGSVDRALSAGYGDFDTYQKSMERWDSDDD